MPLHCNDIIARMLFITNTVLQSTHCIMLLKLAPSKANVFSLIFIGLLLSRPSPNDVSRVHAPSPTSRQCTFAAAKTNYAYRYHSLLDCDSCVALRLVHLLPLFAMSLSRRHCLSLCASPTSQAALQSHLMMRVLCLSPRIPRHSGRPGIALKAAPTLTNAFHLSLFPHLVVQRFSEVVFCHFFWLIVLPITRRI